MPEILKSNSASMTHWPFSSDIVQKLESVLPSKSLKLDSIATNWFTFATYKWLPFEYAEHWPVQKRIKVPILLCSSTSFPNATLTSCQLFFTHFWVGATARQQQTHPKVSDKSGQLVRVAFWKEVLIVNRNFSVQYVFSMKYAVWILKYRYQYSIWKILK